MANSEDTVVDSIVEVNADAVNDFTIVYYSSHDNLYDEKDEPVIKEFLKDQNMLVLEPIFLKEKLDIEALHMIVDSDLRIDNLLSSFPMGVRVKFQRNLKEWLKAFSPQRTFTSVSNHAVSTIENEVPSLETILSTESGRKFNQAVGVNPMTQSDRKTLMNLICGYLLDRGIIVGQSMIAKYTKEIILHFPQETASSFYDEKTKKGPFVARANYLLKSYRETDRIQKPTKRKRVEEESTTNSKEAEFSNLEVQAERFVVDNPNVDYRPLYTHWVESSSYRLHKLKTMRADLNPSLIFTTYQVYDRADAYMLISTDFSLQFPDIDFKTNFQFEIQNLIKVLKDNLKTTNIKKLVSKLEETSTENEQVIAILLGLHSFLYAPGAKNRYSINDSIDKTIKIFSNNQHLESSYRQCLNAIEKKPFIAGLGDLNRGEIQDEFYVIFGEVKYKFTQCLDALELVVQIHMLFKIPFNNQNKKVFNFLLKKFCDITADDASPLVTGLLNMLK